MALESFGNKFRALANVAAKKTGDAVEITKLNLNVTALQGECDELYRRIGVQVYTEIAKGAAHSDETVELSRLVSEKLFEIGQVRNKISDVKTATNEQNSSYTEPEEESDAPLYTAPTAIEKDTYVEVSDDNEALYENLEKKTNN